MVQPRLILLGGACFLAVLALLGQRTAREFLAPGLGGVTTPQAALHETKEAAARRLLATRTFDDLSERAKAHWLHSSWANGPPKGSVQQVIWNSAQTFGKGESCSFLQKMCGCQADWPFEEFGATGICRKNDRSGAWRCAPGWTEIKASPWGCRKTDPNACTDTSGEGVSLEPCGPFPSKSDDRILAIETGFYDLTYDVGASRLEIKSNGKLLGETAGGALAAWGCSGPPDENLPTGGYPVRLIASGRFFAHFWIGGLTCNGEYSEMELKAWPDAFDMELRSSGSVRIAGHIGSEEPSLNGHKSVTARYRVVCGENFDSPSRPCLLLQVHGEPSNKPDVTYASSVDADGLEWQVTLPAGGPHGGDYHRLDSYPVTFRNTESSVAPIRVKFVIDHPHGLTGIIPHILENFGGNMAGMHVQISKNWHTEVPGTATDQQVPYAGAWLWACVFLELPANSQISFHFGIAYQSLYDLPTVSHAQLSLAGSGLGGKGLWEEVGLGANGESITYEPDGQHFRTMICDVRPFLVCGRGSTADGSTCTGDSHQTEWTENHGGGGFLLAGDEHGSFQYLTGMYAHHHYNGPRLTNASYTGTTADGRIKATHTTATWSANDFTRHLHSFRYEVKRSGAYPRMTLYQSGTEFYNAIDNGLHFAYGSGENLIEEHIVSHPGRSNRVRDFIGKKCEGSGPCWFALKTPDGSKLSHSGHGQYAHRGLVVRNFNANVLGTTQPLTWSLMGLQHGGVGIELHMPNGIELHAGDVISGDVELMLYPVSQAIAQSDSQRLGGWLSGSNFWTVVASDAKFCNDVCVATGALERSFPPRVRVDSSGVAAFQIKDAGSWSGVLPVSVTGDISCASGLLFYQVPGGSWQRVGRGPDFQVDRESNGDCTYTFPLPFETDFPNVADLVHFKFTASGSTPSGSASACVSPAPPPVTAPPGLVPVYAYWHAADIDVYLSTWSQPFDSSWVNRGIVFYAFDKQVAGASPIFEYYSHGASDHEYTSRSHPWDSSWIKQKVTFYAYTTPQGGSEVPVFEYHCGVGGAAHSYSPGRDGVPAGHNWIRGAVGFYAFNEMSSTQ